MAATSSDLWTIEDWLRERRRALDDTFDHRYAQLPFVFAALSAQALLDEARLSGLSDEKLEMIRRLVSR